MYQSYHYPYVGYMPVQGTTIQELDYTQQCLQTALQLIKESVQGEREDELFYQYLISIAPTQEEKEIIASIRDDEKKHNQMFRIIYHYFTDQEVQSVNGEQFEKPTNYIDGIKKALFGELKAVEKYRKIKQCLPEGIYQHMLFEIITDELKHATKYNYLFTLNKK
ncbi:rubrerythrin [Domibacillus aminovorans]|uniref:Rubrerythrin n=1 Tax=Domibacillus aminovorans TaxID=29332 RepID=A0A177L2L9_9BACI|nr:ferritin-like domain-containing protein [Domibacillus aminovorans]OAH59696.1 rubrerythrin [Domibacillus aminovorans]